ncbi:hypothetical protein BJ165DRAFT_926280 [Panaeolus papilionaceus]|nr:hypothetical protein BJ165DRAFT_926280 [Panaeolus papilionaceus]
MKLKFTSIASASLLVSATCGSAQKPSPTGWWSNLPKCAANCALKTADILGCAVNDISCLCSVKSVKFSRLELVFNDCLAKTSCSKTDYYTAQAIVRGLCAPFETIGPVPTPID